MGLPPDGRARRQPGSSAQDQPVTTVFVGPGAGHYAAFQPGAGIAMGYDDLKVVEAMNFLSSIAAGRPTARISRRRAGGRHPRLPGGLGGAGVLGRRPGPRRVRREPGSGARDLDVHCRPCHILACNYVQT